MCIRDRGVDGIKSMNNENMWYNGCYTMTSYVQNNEKMFTKNPLYWDTECKLLSLIHIFGVGAAEADWNRPAHPAAVMGNCLCRLLEKIKCDSCQKSRERQETGSNGRKTEQI